MSYQYRKTGSTSSNTRDFGGSYYNSSNISNKSYISGTSNSISRPYESSYVSKYNAGKSYTRPNIEPLSKTSYGSSGKYGMTDYSYEYKPIKKSMRELSNSPSLKYASNRYNETSPYSTYSSRHGSTSYLSDKDSSKYIPSSISSRESVSFISPSNSYSINTRESGHKDVESKDQIMSPKQSSFISRYRRNVDDSEQDMTSNSMLEKQDNESKCDMISKTSRGTDTSANPLDDTDKDCSLISRTRVRKYPKQNVRIEMGSTVLVGNLSQIGKDVSTQTSDEIFLPSPRIRQVSYRSGSSKGSVSASSYYSRGIDANKYSRPTRSNWRQHSFESPSRSIPKIDENVFFDSYSKPVLKEKQLSPKISHRKSTPISIKDSIEKVNEWQMQNQKLESENNSSKSPVPRSPNYHDLHAVTKPSYRKKSNTADIPVNDDKDYTDSSANIVTHVNSPPDSKDQRKLYVTQYTDLDILLQNQFVIKENCKKQGTPLKRDSYNSSFEDSPVLSNESTLIFSSKASKDIFNTMPIELQHIILKSKKRKLKFIDILDICRNGNHMKKFTDEEERSFKGYSNIMEMLIDLGIDMEKLENSVLQLCKFKDNQTEYGPFLDFDLTIQEQIDDLDGYLESGNNAVILRTKLSIRVAALLDKISNASGKELRRALFSLKQIFQDDKDLVQEFVARHGLQCLRQIGSKSDQNHQNYILRALGQLMLYVDGMNGVLKDFETIEWLYSLLQGKFRLVVKLSLKLLVVFIEYATDEELHSSVIISAIKRYHEISGGKPWSLVMKILSDEESNDAELVTYAITFVNKVLSSIPDQDTFYDVTDWLEEQGMEEITKSILNKSNADVDMVKQFTIYENSLKIEDGEGLLVANKEGIRSLPRAKSETKLDGPRKSKRTQINIHSNTESYNNKCNSTQKIVIDDKRKKNEKHNQKIETASEEKESDNSDIDQKNKNEITIQDFGENNMHTVKRRKYRTKEQRLERYKSLGNLYQETKFVNNFSEISSSPPSRPQSLLLEQNENSIFLNHILKPVKERNYSPTSDIDENKTPIAKPEIRVVPDSQESLPQVISPNNSNSCHNQSPSNEDVFFPMNDSSKSNMEVTKQTVKTMKFQSSKSKTINDISKPHQIPTTTGIVSMAKDNLFNAQNKPPIESRLAELKKESSNIPSSSESPDWDLLLKECLKDSLKLKEWDFTDLIEVEDAVDSKENEKLSSLNGIPLPPPPPPSFSSVPPAPGLPKPPIVPTHTQNEMSKSILSGVVKQKRTTRLHWKILPISVSAGVSATIWSKLKPVTIDSEKIESLFENKPHEFKKEMHEVGPKKLEVLDVKRSNAINIGMKNLVSIDCMKNAILNMTVSVINKEGVEKLLRTLLPSQEEIDNIKAAQLNNKDAQLGQAEKFLLDLHEINLLEQRLVVWLYQLEFDQIERDILESLMDLKLGIKEIYDSETLVNVLSAILKLGNFLNETNVTAFSLEYLQKVPEVKDTKHKHSLLYHVVSLVCQQYPKSTDLHSDLSALNRCHRVDWDELFRKLEKLEKDCKQAWEHLKLIFKSDQSLPENIKKLKEFYWSASKRIIMMKIVHKRVISRYDDVLRYLGFSTKEAKELNIQYFCKVLSDFAIEYRTTRERYYQLLEKKKKDKQREKTKGVMIADINSLDRYRKEKSQNENDLLNVIMSRNNLGNSDCDSDFNSLNNRRARRNSNQPPSDKNNNRTFPRPSSSYQMRIQDSSPNIVNITPASSELALDSSDNLIDRLAQQATSSSGKRRTARRLTGTRERKSMRRTKPLKLEDINRNLDPMKIVSN